VICWCTDDEDAEKSGEQRGREKEKEREREQTNRIEELRTQRKAEKRLPVLVLRLRELIGLID
jgi:hypothetical protein